MRILALVTDAYGGHGGIAQANRDLFEALSSEHRLLIVPRTGKRDPAGLPNGLKQENAVHDRAAYSARAAWIAAFGRQHFDAVFCGHLYMAPLADRIARILGKPWWLHLHGIEAWPAPSKTVRAAAENASLVTSVSRYTRRKFLAWSKTEPWRAQVLPDTFESRFSPGPRSEKLVRALGLEGKTVLLTVSRLSSKERYKGHEDVFAALAVLKDSKPGWVYLVAGDGDDRGRLEKAADARGVADRVRFLGCVPDEDLPDLYRAADLFVMPSSGEGFGIAFLEAAACGARVIGGRGQGSVDALAEGSIGRMVEPGRPDELAKAIEEVLAKCPSGAQAAQIFSKERFRAHALRMAGVLLALGTPS